MPRVEVVGMGMSPKDLTAAHLAMIREADLVVGGRRHLEGACPAHPHTLTITADVPGVIRRIRARMTTEKIVVLASGDPLFYGIGATLIRELGSGHVRVHPNISSPAAAFAAVGCSWEGAVLVSCHGRLPDGFDTLLKTAEKMAILTDPVRTPAWIARYLKQQAVTRFVCHVCERLGTREEKIHRFESADELMDQAFETPNVVLLIPENTGDSPPSVPDRRNNPPERDEPLPPEERVSRETCPGKGVGMPDSWFVHEKGMITKSDIRAVVLSRLHLDRDDYTFWDLGAGSGSVSVEAAGFLGRGSVFAVEKNAGRVEMIRENIRRFNRSRVVVCRGGLPGALTGLPRPHRIFIGGGGKEMARIVHTAGGQLRPGGILVANTVLIQSLEQAVTALNEMGFEVSFIQVGISESRPMPFGDRLVPLNPVWVITGKKLSDVAPGMTLEG